MTTKQKIVYMVYYRAAQKWARKISGGSRIRLTWVTDHRKATHWNGTGPLKQSFSTGVFRYNDPASLEIHSFEQELSFREFKTANDFLSEGSK